jgi:hypothetical protein
MTPGLLARLRLLMVRARTRRAVGPPRSRRRAARAALGSGVAAMLVAMVGMAVALETVMPEWRDPEFGHRLTRVRHAQRESPRPVVVVIGTSRTQNAIFPGAMEFSDATDSPRVFNFGQSASPPLKELLTLRRLLGAGVKPSAVVVEVLPSYLMADGPAEQQLAVQAPRLSAADLAYLAPYCADAESLRLAWLRARANPWHAQRQVLMNHWLPRWQPWKRRFEFQWTSLDADGFQPVASASPEFRKVAVAHAQKEYASAFARFSAGAGSVRAVRDLVALCREHRIPVAFLVPPVSPAFRASFAPGVYSAGEAHLLALARRLDVPVFPAPRDMTEDEFLDGHHLLRHGAARYSRWLADNHLRPWLAGQGVGR